MKNTITPRQLEEARKAAHNALRMWKLPDPNAPEGAKDLCFDGRIIRGMEMLTQAINDSDDTRRQSLEAGLKTLFNKQSAAQAEFARLHKIYIDLYKEAYGKPPAVLCIPPCHCICDGGKHYRLQRAEQALRIAAQELFIPEPDSVPLPLQMTDEPVEEKQRAAWSLLRRLGQAQREYRDACAELGIAPTWQYELVYAG